MPAASGSNNLTAVIRLVNREINERLGIANDQRGKVPAADLEAVMNDLDEIGDSVAASIGKARRNAEG